MDVPSGPAVPIRAASAALLSGHRMAVDVRHARRPPQSARPDTIGSRADAGRVAGGGGTGRMIVAAPGLTPSLTVGTRTEERLAYEVFHPEQARAVWRPARTVASTRTGSSQQASRSARTTPSPSVQASRLALGIVPVSTEGDSREALLRNLRDTPVYILEGTRDRNIRVIDGPRSLAEILTGFGYDITYREFGDRAHEGFQEHYDDVLVARRAAAPVYPREVVRVPHPGIVPVSRRVRWIESDTRQGSASRRALRIAST